MTTSPLPPFLAAPHPPVTPPTPIRLQALYASTSSQRLTNPTGYSVNAQWWADVLREVLRRGYVNGEDGDRLVLKVDDHLLGRLGNEDGARPKGIGGVVETQATTIPPILHTLPHYMSSPTPLHAPASLTYRILGRPLWWTFSQLNPFGAAGDTVEKEDVLWKRYGAGKQYVNMTLLEEAAANFTSWMTENPILAYSDALYSPATFLETFSRVCFPALRGMEGDHRLSKRDCEVLLKWLARDSSVVVTEGALIKLLEPGQIPSDHPISEADRGALSIKTTLKRIDEQVDNINAQIDKCQVKAKHHLSLNQRQLALSQLKSKRALQDILTKRLGAGEQLRSVLRGIDQARSDAEIMGAYETSTSTLRAVLSHPSLSREHIDRATDALAEAMADQEEIDTAVRVGGELATGGRVDVDEGDLEAELEGLVQEKGKAEEARVEMERADKEKRERAARERAQREQLEVGDKGLVRETRPAVDEQTASRDESSQTDWEKRYGEALDRRRDEAQRAEAERLKREERRVAAE